MLRVSSVEPEPALAPFVRLYVQRTFDLGASEIIEPVMARLGAMLEFQFADPYAIPAYADGRPNPCPAVTIVGPITYRRVRLLIRGRVEALAVIFQPLGFQALFGVPTAPLAEVGTDAHAVLGPGVSRLHQRLGDLSRLEDRAAVLNAYLKGLVRSESRDPLRLGLQRLAMPDNVSSVAEIAQRIGVSLRHLERKSLDYAGVRPKLSRA